MIFQGYINIDRNPCAATNKQGQRTETLHLYQERPKPVFSDWSTNVSFSRKYLFFFFRKSFSLFVLGLFKEMFSWPRKALRGVDGSRKYLFIFSMSFLFPSTVYSKRCFPDQDRLLGVLTGQENIFLPSASPSLFSFRPPSIQGDVFYDQEMVNRPQWITTSEADTDSRLSVPGWSWVLNGPSLTMEVNIYPKKCQYPGSETVWYKKVRQMDFYSPLIPPVPLHR